VQGGLVTLLAANKLTGGLVASGLGDIASFLLRNLTTINAATVNVMGARVNAPGPLTPDNPTTPKSPGFLGLGGLPTLILGLLSGQQDSFGPEDPITQQLLLRDRRKKFRQNVERSGPQASPGVVGQRVQMQIIDKLTRLAALGDKQNEQASDIWERLGQGNITYQEANRRLNRLIEEGKATTTAIESQKTEVNLAPQINISAAQTGNAITLAATGSRIVIR
jgi:hypothetical protein